MPTLKAGEQRGPPFLSREAASDVAFPLKFLKHFQDAPRFPMRAAAAYDACGNTEHIRQSGWEAL